MTKRDEDSVADYQVNSYIEGFIKYLNTSGTVGLPVAVQCVAPPYMEEVCLRIMKDVELNVSLNDNDL